LRKKLVWGFGSLALLIFFLSLALAWMHGQIRGLDYQLQETQKAVQELREENHRLLNRLNDLIQINGELHRLVLYNVQAKTSLGVASIIRNETERFKNIGLTPGLVIALMRVESAGDRRAVSHANCYGLLQLLPSTAIPHLRSFGFRVREGDDIRNLLFIPEINVLCGIRELVRLRQKHLWGGIDSWHVTLIAYLYGPEGIPGLRYSQNVIRGREEIKNRGIL